MDENLTTTEPTLLKESDYFKTSQPTPPVNQNAGFVDTTLNTFNNTQATNPSFAAGGEAVAKTILDKTLTPNYPGKKLQTKVGEDVVAIGASIPIALAHPIDTLKSLVTTKEDPIGGAIWASAKQVFDGKYYKEHPALAVLNDAVWVSNFLDFGLSSVVKGFVDHGLSIAVDGAAKAGIDATIESVALKNSIKQAMKTGNADIIAETSKASLIKKGVDINTASEIASKVQAGITQQLTEKSGLIKTLTPIKTATEILGGYLKPVKDMIFGTPAESAVGKLYSVEAIKANPEGFSAIEDWASKQVQQQGLKDTIENRITEMNRWAKDNGEWASLKPEERAKYQMDYVKASDLTTQLNTMLGNSSFVPGRFLSEDTASAIKETIQNTQGTRAGVDLMDELKRTFGSDLQNYETTLNNIMADNGGNVAKLKTDLSNFIDSISTSAPKIKFTGNPQADALIQRIKDETGYTPTLAQENKTIIFAKNGVVDKSLTANMTDGLIAHRSVIGKYLDKWGFSTAGTPEGTVEATYASQFSGASGRLGVKTVKIGTTSVPVANLYSYLSKIKNKLPTNALTGSKFSVADITATDLIKLGVDRNLAGKIEALAKESAIMPVSQTGIAQTLVDTAQAYIPGYSKYLKTIGNIKYNSILSPFFALRVYGKMQVLKTLEGGGFKLQLGSGVGRVANLLRKIPYLRDVIAPEVSIGEQKIMSDEIFSRMPKETKDYISNPDVNLEEINTSSNVKFQNQTQSRMFWHNALGYSTSIDSTAFAKTIAKKYGMELPDALSFTIKDGAKIYNNPEIVDKILTSVENTFHYRSGLMTSPLMKTLNIVMFPLRFETKVLTATANWMKDMAPMQRSIIMSDLNHWSNFIQTPEGKKYLKDNSNLFQKTLEYILPYEGLAMTFSDIINGKFDPRAHFQVGGIPFGFIIPVFEDLGIMSAKENTINPLTNKRIGRSVPKNLVSKQSMEVFLMDTIMHAMPSLPFYSMSDGAVGDVSVQRDMESVLQGMVFSSDKKSLKDFKHGFKPVSSSYSRVK